MMRQLDLDAHVPEVVCIKFDKARHTFIYSWFTYEPATVGEMRRSLHPRVPYLAQKASIMRRAIYYPHTSVDNEMLVKSALLLWDKLECIVPWQGFNYPYQGEMAQAMKLVGTERYPTDEEKKEAHNLLANIFTRPLPEIFHYDVNKRGNYEDYEVYPQKLLDETWDMLERLKAAGAPLRNLDRPLSEPAGLTIMSIIADCGAEQRASDEINSNSTP